MKIALDHSALRVSNWARSNAFYRDVMGAEVTQRGAGFLSRFGAQGEGVSVYFRDPDGNLLKFISYGEQA